MTQKNTDKLLREKLNNYASDVPSHIWDNIDAARRPSRAAAWWSKAGMLSLLTLTTVLGGAGIWYFTSDTNTNTNVDHPITEKVIAETNTAISTTPKNELIAEDYTQNTINNSETSNNQTETKNNTNSTSAKNPVQVTAPRRNVTINSTAIVDKSSENDKAKSSIAVVEDITIINSSSDATITEETPVITENNSSTLSEEARATRSASSNKVAKKSTKKFRADWTVLKPLTTVSPRLGNGNNGFLMPDVQCAWKGRQLFFYTDMLGAVEIPYRTFRAKNTDFEGYAQTREATEHVSFSGGAGMRFSAVLLRKNQRPAKAGEAIKKANKNGLALRTGFMYTQINEKYQRQIGTNERYTIIDGDTVSVEIVPINDIGDNQYRMLDIPVILGYEYDTEKYSFSVNGGAYFNIIFDQVGRYASVVDGQLQSVSFDAEPQIYRPELGMSLYGSFALNYKLNPALHIVFEPYGRYHLEPFTNDSYALEQRYFNAGILSGLRFKF